MRSERAYRFAHKYAPGDYYRFQGTGETYLKTGSLAVITSVEADSVVVNCLDFTVSFDLEEFERDFVYEPDGLKIRQEEKENILRAALEIVEEIKSENSEIERLTSREKSTGRLAASLGTDTSNTAVDAGSEQRTKNYEEPDSVEAGTDANQITKVQEDLTVDAVPSKLTEAQNLRVKLSERRDRVRGFERTLTDCRNRLKNLRSEYDAYLEAILQFKDLSKKIEDTVYTLNIYLGTGEEIVQIKKGAPAAVTEKLVFRQLCLYAAEESLIRIEEGGINNEDISDFDEWLRREENLRQILPEPKAVVAIKPRRENKDYGHRVANYFNNLEKHKTYFILRNGENVYRLAPNFNVGERLFPSRNEFEQLFTEEYYDAKSECTRSRRLHPGDANFERRVKAAGEKELSYARGLILFQGIIDRTKIFPDLHERRINLLDIENGSRWVSYIEDAEPTRLLETGIPSFEEWLKKAQQETQTGDRITGNFTGQNLDYDSSSGRAGRLSPSNAEFPDSEQIYVLEKKRGGEMIFLYNRGENVEKRNAYGWSYGPATRRASCSIQTGDKWWLPIDRLKIKYIEFWLRDRISRSAYLNMIPLLLFAKSILAEEAAGEQPVRELLLGLFIKIQERHLPKDYLLSLEELEETVIRLIRWWRMKNKYHRALRSDHDKAVRMIENEFVKIIEVRSEEAKNFGNREKILAGIVSPKTIFIYQQRAKEIIALERENADNIFVNRKTYRIRRGGHCEIAREERWKQIRQLPGGMTVWHETKEWENWYRGSRTISFLNDEEIELNIGEWVEQTGALIEDESRRPAWNRDKISNYELYLYAATMTANGALHFYYGEIYPKRGEKSLSLDYIFEAKTNRYRSRMFERRGSHGSYENQTIILEQGGSHRTGGYKKGNQFREPQDFLGANLNAAWHVSAGGSDLPEDSEKLLWFDETICRALIERANAVRPHNRFVNECRDKARAGFSRLANFLFDREYERLEREYKDGFGDPHHWEDHKRCLKVPHYFDLVKDIEPVLLGLTLLHVALDDLPFVDLIGKSEELLGTAPEFGGEVDIPRDFILFPAEEKAAESGGD